MVPQAVSRRPQAFTLIELLVVVTIIVVLLALLTPAVDRAIYQAELARCAAQLHGICAGVQVYAAENKRWYPQRHGNNADQNSYWEPNRLYDGGAAIDER